MKAFIVPNGGTGPSGDAAPSKDVLEDRKLVGFYLREGQLQAAVGLGRGGDPELDQDSEMAACARLVGQQIRPIPSQLSDDAVDLWSLVA